jgi:hypothetical protein
VSEAGRTAERHDQSSTGQGFQRSRSCTTARLCLALLAFGGTGCRCDRQDPVEAQVRSSPVAVALPNNELGSDDEARSRQDPWPELKWYAWVADASRSRPEPVDTVMHRFTRSLSGFRGFPAELGSFAEWLRLLPLAAPATPVRNHRGDIVVPGDDEHLAAVVAIDVGTEDVQQSADVILRLHAEWRWFRSDFRMLYLSDNELELPLQPRQNGEHLVDAADQSRESPDAAPQSKREYADFRRYLDRVFARSDAPALLAESVALPPQDLEPGAFFLNDRHPAEVLVVLDVATSPTGQRRMLLAQALNPAQDLAVIRPNRDTAWFAVHTDQPVRVPRAHPFAWKDLRRMKRLRSAPEVPCVGSLCPKPLTR